jgi:hypothetical protein
VLESEMDDCVGLRGALPKAVEVVEAAAPHLDLGVAQRVGRVVGTGEPDD